MGTILFTVRSAEKVAVGDEEAGEDGSAGADVDGGLGHINGRVVLRASGRGEHLSSPQLTVANLREMIVLDEISAFVCGISRHCPR